MLNKGNSHVKKTILNVVFASRCIQEARTEAETPVGLNSCKMTCGEAGMLWPLPTVQVQLSRDLVNFLPQDLKV
jgi:hypothetical protein